MPLPALCGLAAGFFLAYLTAETVLGYRVHPLHWLVIVTGAAAGYLVGWLTLAGSAQPWWGDGEGYNSY
jgi:hypothetical protein